MFREEEKKAIGKYLHGEIARVKIKFKKGSIKRKNDELNELERMLSPFYAIEGLLEMELGYKVRIYAKYKEIKHKQGPSNHEFIGYDIYKVKPEKHH